MSTSLKIIPSCGGVPERRGGSKRGSALVVVMWVLVIVAMIVSSFAFEMQMEARIISAQRKRFKADQLALAGIEMAKAMLFVEKDANKTDEDKKKMSEDKYLNNKDRLEEFLPVDYTEAFGDGEVTVKIDYEEGRHSIKTLTPKQWHMIFDQAGIPNSQWDKMLGCLKDWQDENDLHELNGAESDDSFYKKRGYECKNAPIDTVDELLLIKNWGKEVLYGTPEDEKTDNPITGIAKQLTTWGDGKIDPNSASVEVLNGLKISDGLIDAILEARLGPDGEAGTDDDGIRTEDFASMGLDAGVFTLTPYYASVTAIGTVGNVQSQISCIFKLGEKEPIPLFWLEGKLSK